jgi:hypothetical protein
MIPFPISLFCPFLLHVHTVIIVSVPTLLTNFDGIANEILGEEI